MMRWLFYRGGVSGNLLLMQHVPHAAGREDFLPARLPCYFFGVIGRNNRQ